jgi:hypothetical protein
MCGHSWGAHLLAMMLSLAYSEETQKKFALIKGKANTVASSRSFVGLDL